MLEVTLHPYKNGICEKDISYKKGDIGSDDFLSLLGLEGHIDVAISIYDDGDIEISDISGRVGGDDEIVNLFHRLRYILRLRIAHGLDRDGV